MARLSEELGNRIIEGLLDSMKRGTRYDMHLTNDGHEIPEEIIQGELDKIRERLILEVPVVYYRGTDRIIIGKAKINPDGSAAIMVDEGEIGSVLKDNEMHISLAIQEPMRWMPSMRIDSFGLNDHVYEAVQKMNQINRATIENKPE
jgi:hypothetical protein